MVPLTELWLPILVASMVCFFSSYVLWSLSPHHKPDVKKLPDEKALTDTLARLNVKPGHYMWPLPADKADMKSKEFQARYAQGPWGGMTVQGARPNFGRNLFLVFVFYIVVNVFVAYLTSLARDHGALYLDVFQVAGAAAVLAFCAASIPNAIFFGKPIRFVFTDLFDGIVNGLLVAGVFASMWPKGG